MQEITKRLRSFDIGEDAPTEREGKLQKCNDIKAFDFHCAAFYCGKIVPFRLSDVFRTANYAILFFCSYDFTDQSRIDLYQIQEYFPTFVEKGVLPLVVTQDSVHTHRMYAMPGLTLLSLDFKPSFALASDFEDRLISTAFNAMDMETREIKRTVVVVQNTLEILFHHHVPQEKELPLKILANCFKHRPTN